MARRLFNQILQRLSALVAEHDRDLIPTLEVFPSDLPAADLTTKFVERIELHAKALEKAGYELPILCFLDEVERILPRRTDPREKAEEFNACFGALRTLIQEQQIIGLLVADVHPDFNRINEWPQEDVASNPVFSFFKEVFLSPFSKEETTTMITGLGRWTGRKFDDKTLIRIYNESGGHPFVARQLASLLYSHVTQIKTAADGESLIVFSSAKRYLEKPFTYSNVLKDYFSQNIWVPLKKRNFNSAMVILKLLAANGRLGKWLIEPALRAKIRGSYTENQLLDAFFWLEATGLILRNQTAGPARYRIEMSLLVRWLRLNMTDKEIQQWRIV